MFTKKFIFIAVAMIFALGTMSVHAQDAGALLDLLVKKHLITDQEAEEVRGELVKESAETSAGKWKLSTPITEIELYGDARLRYQYNGGRTDNTQWHHPVPAWQGHMIGRSANASVIVFASVCAASWLTTGSLAFDWRRMQVTAQQT
jgi:hypothetical protein